MSDPPRVRIISDNHQYHTYEGIANEVNIIGRVRWYVSAAQAPLISRISDA
jgi:phage repressor protein C with HTH and peptisase S24 domain